MVLPVGNLGTYNSYIMAFKASTNCNYYMNGFSSGVVAKITTGSVAKNNYHYASLPSGAKGDLRLYVASW